MSGILASMIDGLLIGSVYGLAAMGLSLIWGVMDVINLTHGAVIALGMFGMYLLFTALHLNAYLLLLPIIAIGSGVRHAGVLDVGALGYRPLAVVESALDLRREHDHHRRRHRYLEHQPVQRKLQRAGFHRWSSIPSPGTTWLQPLACSHHRFGAGVVPVSHSPWQSDPGGGR